MGTIVAWAPNFAPQNWMYCKGQLLAISQYNALFALLGTTYGGNGTTTFQLPNLSGRTPIGAGQSPGGSTYVLGQMSGTETVTLLTTQMPAHTHIATVGSLTVGSITIKASSQDASDHNPSATANTLASPIDSDGSQALGYNNSAPDTALNVAGSASVSGTVTNTITGGNQPFSIMQPYLAVNYIICTSGLFPPRN